MRLQVRSSKFHTVRVLILFAIASILTLPLPARAQEFTFDSSARQPFAMRGADVFGTVYFDRSTQGAPKVVVSLRSLSSGLIQRVITDYAGHFEVHGIPPGVYEFSVEEEGYKSTSTVVQVNVFSPEVSLHLKSANPAPPSGSANVVSVRELKIPAKAQNEYSRGLALMAKGDPLASLTHFNKATAAFPQYYEAFFEIGVAEDLLQHRDNALEAFQKSIDLSGGHYARAQFAYGLLLCKQGKSEEGERIMRAGLDSDSNAAEGHLFLAVALLNQGRLDEAQKSVQEAFLRKPRYPDAYLVLADIHGRKKDYPSQLQDFDMYLKLVPSMPESDRIRQMRDIVKRLADESSSPN